MRGNSAWNLLLCVCWQPTKYYDRSLSVRKHNKICNWKWLVLIEPRGQMVRQQVIYYSTVNHLLYLTDFSFTVFSSLLFLWNFQFTTALLNLRFFANFINYQVLNSHHNYVIHKLTQKSKNSWIISDLQNKSPFRSKIKATIFFSFTGELRY